MTLTAAQLARVAAESGHHAESVEKVARLLDLLSGLRSHPYLRTRLALKGGTALNLFVLDVPRLSVDIDLNVIGAESRDEMLAERPLVERAVTAVCGRLGLQVQRSADEHAGGKWRLSYTTAFGRPGALGLDLNYLLRLPLWPVATSDSRKIGPLQAQSVPVVDIHELAAGKLAALFDRAASRDLFDVVELFRSGRLDHDRLRLAFVVYGGASRRDWRAVSLDDVTADPKEVDRSLLPMLRADLVPSSSDLAEWVDALVAECRNGLSAVLPLLDIEVEFLSRLNDEGRICPELLTTENRLRDDIAQHPALLWKAKNVREYKGDAGGGAGVPVTQERGAPT